MSEDPTRADAPLRVRFVPGVTPDKWARAWGERMPRGSLDLSPVEQAEQTAVLYDGRADMCFVRLPVETERLHVIPLYSEVPVVVVPKGHFVEAADEVSVTDLCDEHLVGNPDAVPEWRDVATEISDGTRTPVPELSVRQAVETVAAGVGIVIVPMSVARLHHRKDLVHRPVIDVAESRIGLAWRRDLDDDRVDAFIGIVRGRTANSSRGGTVDSPQGRTASRSRVKGSPKAQRSRGRRA